MASAGYQTLVALRVHKRHSVPLCWGSCGGHTYDGHRSRKAFEESLLLMLRSMVPRVADGGPRVILLADRGFGRATLAAFLRWQGVSYLIRVQPKVAVRLKGFAGMLLDYPVKKGIAEVLKFVACHADGAVTQHVVVRWWTDLPGKQDECWFLMSDLLGTAYQLCDLYGRRMTIEQLFRDGKNKRNG